MTTTTLSALRSRARSRADMPSPGFVSDAEFNDWIREGVQLLHQKLVDALGEQYVEASANINTVAGQSDYTLPADFYKLYEVNVTVAGRVRTVNPTTRAMRNYFNNPSRIWTSEEGVMFHRLVGNGLRLFPTPAAVLPLTVRYAPEAPALALDADTVAFPNGWERYVVLYAAIQAGLKEETDVRGLQVLLDREEVELAVAKEQRNLTGPKQAVDVEALSEEVLLWR